MGGHGCIEYTEEMLLQVLVKADYPPGETNGTLGIHCVAKSTVSFNPVHSKYFI